MKGEKVAHNLKEKWRSSDIEISEVIDFQGLLLSEKVLAGLTSAGFSRPSPIQLQAIPLGRCGFDIIMQAKSGTGKTCVFTVLALENLLESSGATQVLVLTPTREIAVQIQQVILAIGFHFTSLQCHAFIGGLPVHQDKLKLKNCQIAVGTPGRIKQLLEGGALKTETIRILVLDEADKLLDESFKADINWIFAHLPERKQMIAASATYPEYLAQNLTLYMRNPIFIRLDTQCQELLGVTQYLLEVDSHPLQQVVFQRKMQHLLELFKNLTFNQCIIFTNYQGRSESLCDVLTKEGWPAVYISGHQDQSRRLSAMQLLKEFKCRIIASTDVTSRGIDAENVNLVINFDVPWNAETYLHRIGRAGRFGSRGIAVTLATQGKEFEELQHIQKKCFLHIFRLPDISRNDLWKHSPSSTLKNICSIEAPQILEDEEQCDDLIDSFSSLWHEPEKPVDTLTYEEFVMKTEESTEVVTTCDQHVNYTLEQLEKLGCFLNKNHSAFCRNIEKRLENDQRNVMKHNNESSPLKEVIAQKIPNPKCKLIINSNKGEEMANTLQVASKNSSHNSRKQVSGNNGEPENSLQSRTDMTDSHIRLQNGFSTANTKLQEKRHTISSGSNATYSKREESEERSTTCTDTYTSDSSLDSNTNKCVIKEDTHVNDYRSQEDTPRSDTKGRMRTNAISRKTQATSHRAAFGCCPTCDFHARQLRCRQDEHCCCENSTRRRSLYNYTWASHLPTRPLQRAYFNYCYYMEEMLCQKKWAT